jgi:hypothetical protein
VTEEPDELLRGLRARLDTPGPALPLSERDTAELVDGVLAKHARAGAIGSRGWRRAALAAAPALVALAAAAYLVRGGAEQPSAATNAAPAASVAAPAASMAAAAPATPPRIDGAAAPLPRRDAATPSSPRDREHGSRAPADVPLTASRPEDLLLQANRFRRKGEWQKAEQKYLEVTRTQPGTLSSYVALASVASLQLQRNPRAALGSYEAARAANPAGPLDADIRWGIARAHHALGNARAERAALEGLLRAHPRSAAADRARDRLRTISH